MLQVNISFAFGSHSRSIVWQCLMARPNDDTALYNRGVLYIKLKKYHLAITDFSNAIALNQKFKDAYFNRSVCYGELKKYSDAISDYTICIEINPSYGKAYYYRAIDYYNTGNVVEACADANKALDLGITEAAQIRKLSCK